MLYPGEACRYSHPKNDSAGGKGVTELPKMALCELNIGLPIFNI
jgi:hypothetical protein